MSTSTAELIRQLFEKAPSGGVTTQELAEQLLHALPMSDVQKFAVQGAQSYVRQVLRQKDSLGLPIAGRSFSKLIDDQYCWLPRDVWTQKDYEWNIKTLVNEATQMDLIAHGLRRECRERFGECRA